MDRGIWATWYDLEANGKKEYLSWLHDIHLPAMLARPGYLWVAHVENVVSPERETRNDARLTHVGDPSNALDNEAEMSAWYARSRLPLVKPLAGSVGARKLVSIAGWAKHAILYEFSSLKAAEANLADPSEWTRRVIGNLVHAPHSPTLGVRIWPAVQGG